LKHRFEISWLFNQFGFLIIEQKDEQSFQTAFEKKPT